MSNLEYAPPKYVQIYRTIQERIEDGTYAVGEMLPSESRMVREFGAGRSTVVRALHILSLQGWIEREHGRGSFVKGIPVSAAERSHAGASAFDSTERARDHVITRAGREGVPPHVADALAVPEGSPAIVRQRLLSAEGEPSELVTLWFPLDVADGTDLGSAEIITIGAREHLQAVKQVRPAKIHERLSARHATEEEAKLLKLEDDPPVLGIVARVLDTAGDTIAVADVALPGDLHELEDSYPAD